MTSLEIRIQERNEAHATYRAALEAYRAFKIEDAEFEAARGKYMDAAARISWGEEA